MILSSWKAARAEAKAEVEVEATHTVAPIVDHIHILPVHGPGQDLGHTPDQDHTLLILQDPDRERDLLQYQEGGVLLALWTKEE